MMFNFSEKCGGDYVTVIIYTHCHDLFLSPDSFGHRKTPYHCYIIAGHGGVFMSKSGLSP